MPCQITPTHSHPTLALQAYVASGKPDEVLSEAERFVISLMAAPRAAPRLRAFSMRFVTAEKHAEAAAMFTVGTGGGGEAIAQGRICGSMA